MKKLFVAFLLALAVMTASQQRASAWSEFKFGVGLNLGWVGGGNRFFWGAYHSAPYPGGQDLGPWLPGVGAALGYGNGGYAPAPVMAAPVWQAPPPAQAPGHAQMPAGPAPMPTAGLTNGSGLLQQQGYYNSFESTYQPVSYSYPGYYQYQAPSYWYGR